MNKLQKQFIEENKREIKFRGWSYELKKMEYFEFSCIGDNYHYYDQFIDEVVMQYTGRKDVKGKEEFTGDIVQDPETKKTYLIGRGSGGGVNGLTFTHINHEQDNYNGKEYDDEDLYHKCLWNGNFDIIGNVFEHPELLDVL